MVKNLPAMQETWVQSLGREHPLEKGMVIHSSILAWRNPWTEEPGRLQSIGSQRVGHDRATNIFTFHFVVNKIVITLYRDSRITTLIVMVISNVCRHQIIMQHT